MAFVVARAFATASPAIAEAEVVTEAARPFTAKAVVAVKVVSITTKTSPDANYCWSYHVCDTCLIWLLDEISLSFTFCFDGLPLGFWCNRYQDKSGFQNSFENNGSPNHCLVDLRYCCSMIENPHCTMNLLPSHHLILRRSHRCTHTHFHMNLYGDDE